MLTVRIEGIVYSLRNIAKARVLQAWDGDRFTFVDNITSAWLPTNNDTLTIDYNQRFIISDPRHRPPVAWKVSKYEDTQPLGLIKLKFTQETFDPVHDNEELMLANYYDSPILPEAPDPVAELHNPVAITYSGTQPTLRVGGNFKTFTPLFKNEGVTSQKWMISDENGDITADTENYIIEYEGNKLKLKIARNYNLIGKVLIIQVIGSDGSVGEIKTEVVG